MQTFRITKNSYFKEQLSTAACISSKLVERSRERPDVSFFVRLLLIPTYHHSFLTAKQEATSASFFYLWSNYFGLTRLRIEPATLMKEAALSKNTYGELQPFNIFFQPEQTLISVDGESLTDVTHREAVKLLRLRYRDKSTEVMKLVIAES